MLVLKEKQAERNWNKIIAFSILALGAVVCLTAAIYDYKVANSLTNLSVFQAWQTDPHGACSIAIENGNVELFYCPDGTYTFNYPEYYRMTLGFQTFLFLSGTLGFLSVFPFVPLKALARFKDSAFRKYFAKYLVVTSLGIFAVISLLDYGLPVFSTIDNYIASYDLGFVGTLDFGFFTAIFLAYRIMEKGIKRGFVQAFFGVVGVMFLFQLGIYFLSPWTCWAPNLQVPIGTVKPQLRDGLWCEYTPNMVMTIWLYNENLDWITNIFVLQISGIISGIYLGYWTLRRVL